MRNFVTRINPQEIHINALFLQPTTLCNLNCNGCYVKAWGDKHPEGTEKANKIMPYFYRTLLDEMIEGKRISANQVTFALDTPDSYDQIQQGLFDAYFGAFLSGAKRAKDAGVDMEFHVTTQGWSTLRHYMDSPSMPTLEGIDVISFSTPVGPHRYEELKRKYPNLHINTNMTLYPKIGKIYSETNFESRTTLIKKCLDGEKENPRPRTDSIYLILHKPDVGEKYDQDYVDYYQSVAEHFKDNPNVMTDGCIQDSKKFLKTGHGCSSNISRFQIWPDGSVSGCPYSHNPITPGVGNVKEETEQLEIVLNNIRAANKIYQFDKCKIPDVVMPKQQRIQLKRKKSLKILED